MRLIPDHNARGLDAFGLQELSHQRSLASPVQIHEFRLSDVTGWVKAEDAVARITLRNVEPEEVAAAQ